MQCDEYNKGQILIRYLAHTWLGFKIWLDSELLDFSSVCMWGASRCFYRLTCKLILELERKLSLDNMF